MQVAAFDSEEPCVKHFSSVHAAQAWRDRVQHWADNLRRNLTQDSVPAPKDNSKRWLLYASDSLSIDNTTGNVTCQFCKRCASALGRDARFGKKPKLATMPAGARANGLWHGPDPAELRQLTYTECKVINLERIYVSAKHIYLDRRSFAGTSKDEAPRYHHNNVVAYPQSPDAALKALGCTPAALAQTVLVQFTNGDENELRNHPDVQVSVPNLRAAFRWLCANNWQFLEATKNHEAWNNELLPDPLEHLLASYQTSIGKNTGVPTEILRAATVLSNERCSINQQGPADCVPDVAEDMAEGNEASELPDANPRTTNQSEEAQCAAVLHGGMDDVGPIQLWNAVMEKYKVAQVCER